MPEGVPVSDPLWFVLERAQTLAAMSRWSVRCHRGAPGPALAPVAPRKGTAVPRAAGRSRGGGGLSSPATGSATHRVRLLQPHMRLDLGGIAMGYAVDEVLKLLAEQGITRALVDASGDIGVGDPPPGEEGWKIGIAPMVPGGPPSRMLILSRAAVTTSGDAFQYVEIAGRRYSHIIDAKTGLGLTDRMRRDRRRARLHHGRQRDESGARAGSKSRHGAHRTHARSSGLDCAGSGRPR